MESTYKGVNQVKRRSKTGEYVRYRVRLRKEGKVVYEKLWKEEVNAAKAYDFMLLQFFGDTPETREKMNFPDETPDRLPEEPHARAMGQNFFPGVSYEPERGWRGSVTKDGIRHTTSYFSSPYQANNALYFLKRRLGVD